MNPSCTLRWDRGSAKVMAMGALLTDVLFELPDRRLVSPLHKAPWLGKDLPPDTPPLLAHLQGEWPCVPFGAPPEAPLDGAWRGLQPKPVRWPHGYGANHPWILAQDSPNMVTARIDYPNNSPIASLSRQVRGRPGEAALDITLEIRVRCATQVPVGLHPVFRLPEAVGAARLILGRHGKIWSYPSDSGGVSAFEYREPVATFEDLANGAFDPLNLPYRAASETLLLLADAEGQVSLQNNAENYRATLTWDAEALPSLMLWISNMGRQSTPWQGQHLALGLEPVCAPFDLGQAMIGPETPLAKAGTKTAVSIHPDTPWRTHYAIGVEPCAVPFA
ncbi:hypothetical protein [Tateyamaria sp.]|uniref:hypothetical protein n=1 Tax=Tateyamaria sp. TaxID=1929288 RepID=UPI00329DB17C